MPKNLPTSILIQKNLISSTSPWLILVDIGPPTGEIAARLVNNNEDIVFQGNTYTAFPFKISFGADTSTGEIPKFKLMVSNVTRTFQWYVEELKGAVGYRVIIRVVNMADLSADYSSFTVELSILSTEVEGFDWITFTLGAPNPMIMELLPFVFNPYICNWVSDYRGPECGYTGALSECNGTLEDCRRHGNSKRFGGHPGLKGGGIRIG